MQRGQPKYNYERAFGLAWLGRMGGWTHCKLATPKPNEARMGARCANGNEALRPAAANHDAPTEQKLSRFTPLQVARTTSRTYNAPTACKRDARHAQPGCNITCPKLVLQLAALSAWTQSSRGPLRFCSQTNFGLPPSMLHNQPLQGAPRADPSAPSLAWRVISCSAKKQPGAATQKCMR